MLRIFRLYYSLIKNFWLYGLYILILNKRLNELLATMREPVSEVSTWCHKLTTVWWLSGAMFRSESPLWTSHTTLTTEDVSYHQCRSVDPQPQYQSPQLISFFSHAYHFLCVLNVNYKLYCYLIIYWIRFCRIICVIKSPCKLWLGKPKMK